MAQDILITPGSGEPQILFRGSGTHDSAIELNVLSSYQSAGAGSGSALIFEGTQGQLFGITDNLSSGTIFSVSDITGLPSIEVNSDGQVKICEYGSGTLLFNDLTGNDSLINISGVALGISGIRFSDDTTLTTAPSAGMSNFILEDDDGTEVTVSDGKEVKIIGDGITTNWTDVSDGSDGDPYDLTLSVDAAQTNITSILATDVKIGEDDQTKIDFETEDEIHFYAANAEQVYVADGVFGPQTDSDVDLGATSVRWKDAYVDSITTTDKITAGGSINQAPNTATDGGIVDIDCSTSNYHEILMNADATRINFTNVTAGQRVIVRFKQHSSHIDLNSSEGFNDVDVNGGNATIKWAGGIVPTLTESNNAVDVYGFIFESTVTNVMAFIIGQDIK